MKSERDQFSRKSVVFEEQSTLLQEQIKSLNQEKVDAENGQREVR